MKITTTVKTEALEAKGLHLEYTLGGVYVELVNSEGDAIDIVANLMDYSNGSINIPTVADFERYAEEALNYILV